MQRSGRLCQQRSRTVLASKPFLRFYASSFRSVYLFQMPLHVLLANKSLIAVDAPVRLVARMVRHVIPKRCFMLEQFGTNRAFESDRNFGMFESKMDSHRLHRGELSVAFGTREVTLSAFPNRWQFGRGFDAVNDLLVSNPILVSHEKPFALVTLVPFQDFILRIFPVPAFLVLGELCLPLEAATANVTLVWHSSMIDHNMRPVSRPVAEQLWTIWTFEPFGHLRFGLIPGLTPTGMMFLHVCAAILPRIKRLVAWFTEKHLRIRQTHLHRCIRWSDIMKVGNMHVPGLLLQEDSRAEGALEPLVGVAGRILVVVAGRVGVQTLFHREFGPAIVTREWEVIRVEPGVHSEGSRIGKLFATKSARVHLRLLRVVLADVDLNFLHQPKGFQTDGAPISSVGCNIERQRLGWLLAGAILPPCNAASPGRSFHRLLILV